MPSDVDNRYSPKRWIPEASHDGSRSRPPTVIARQLTGVLTAAFLLVGRWEPARDLDATYAASRQVDFGEPRFLIAIVLAVVVASLPLAQLRHSRPANSAEPRPRRVVFALGVFLVLSIAWSINRPAGVAKASEIVLLASVAALFSAATFGEQGKSARAAFWVSLIAVSCLLGIMGIRQVVAAGIQSTNRDIVAPLGGGPNIFGRNMAVLTVALIVLALSQRIPRRLGLPAAAVSGLLVALSGSRGALLALSVGVLVAVILVRPSARMVAIAAVAVGLTLAALAGSTTVIDQAGVVVEQRLDLSSPTNQFSYSRAGAFQEGIACYADYPVTGAGLAGFVALSPGFAYPHNIFLEIGCEGGIIGVFLSLWLFMAVAAILWKARRFLDPLPVAVLVVAFVSAQFSGDVFDARGLLIFGLLALRSHQSAGWVTDHRGVTQAPG